jgi:hypothetical protein
MIICEIINSIANIFIGFFNFLSSPLVLKIIFVVPAGYVFFQRVHSQTQQRAFKAISDELVKINDFIIEFISKLDVIEPDTEIEAKNISELNALKNKINAHINYTQEYILGFPYGGPLNHVYFLLFKHYLFPQPKKEIEDLEFTYQELILNDTVLSLEKEFIEDKKLKPLDDHTLKLDQEAIDNIVATSRALLEHLEDNSRKIL